MEKSFSSQLSIAFPSISTGIYGYPIEQAARIAVGSVYAIVRRQNILHDVVFCCFSKADLNVYEDALREGDTLLPQKHSAKKKALRPRAHPCYETVKAVLKAVGVEMTEKPC